MPQRRARRAAGTIAVLAGALVVAACGAGTDPAPGGGDTGASDVIRVPDDAATIGEAIDLADPGDMVLIAAGTYPEEVTVDVPDLTLRGEDRNGVIIDGGGVRTFGVFASADGVRIENLTVTSTLFYGVLVTGMHDENGPIAHGGPGYTTLDPEAFPPVQRFSIDHVTAANNGLYGIYAFNAQHGVIADSYASGSADSGFYVGQCEQCDILVTGNVAERNAIGFENANASDSVVIAGNRFSHNRIGMTLISNYQEAFTPQRGNLVMGNLISDNTSADSPAHALGGFGVGLSLVGGQDNTVVANRIEGNPLTGIQLGNTEDIAASGNTFTGNVLGDNGLDLGDASADRTPSAENCFEPAPATVSPSSLAEAVCPSGNEGGGVDTTDWPTPEVPPGISFLDVPMPPSQPEMPDPETSPSGPLPETVTMPEAAGAVVPDAELLADRSGAS
ncbi:right-handed parallel beta-helix repeat-containing protein [Pseudactinotalea suaedae]|uniref:right-handed parallel beta-helix repeat-containing protein n=1 Tax=Pseudactinotalea suaedae TaxID=1524924 RepID=UPI0012E1D58F|nr:right-handed parallel beta-helix repeat-containing protein [Pseudactinotalea suaedae]